MRAVNRESSCFVSLDAAAAAVRCLLETIRLVAVFVIVAPKSYRTMVAHRVTRF